ncbi:MAG: glycosyltransferase family 2 protein [Candidatus Marinimicrobia bacterium]|nr:glycosyltransferase family 2 protein [Candidatus Neomarinimicrobiota bacterium]
MLKRPPKLDEVIECVHDPIVNRKKCVVVIPTYNQKYMTCKVIEMLMNQSFVPDVIVVDGGSTDGTAEFLLSKFEDIILIRTGDYGGAGSQYIGGLYAFKEGYEIVIFSDNDAVPVSEDMVERIVRYIENLSPTERSEILVAPTDIYYKIWRGGEVTDEALIVHSQGFWYLTAHRDFIEMKGLPLFYFFLFYDDVEYTSRAKAIHLLRTTHYYHPFKISRCDRIYYIFRNYLYASSFKNFPHLTNAILSLFVFFTGFHFLSKWSCIKFAIKGMLSFILGIKINVKPKRSIDEDEVIRIKDIKENNVMITMKNFGKPSWEYFNINDYSWITKPKKSFKLFVDAIFKYEYLLTSSNCCSNYYVSFPFRKIIWLLLSEKGDHQGILIERNLAKYLACLITYPPILLFFSFFLLASLVKVFIYRNILKINSIGYGTIKTGHSIFLGVKRI